MLAIIASAPPESSDDLIQTIEEFLVTVRNATWFSGAVSTALSIFLIVFVCLFIRGLLVRSVRRLVGRIADHHTKEGQDSTTAAIAAARKAQRVTTLGSLFNNIITVVVLTIMAVLILGELGINMTPLLASASIVAAALAFGAQSLVQDFMAGIFILMEDQYGVGDVVDVGDASGTIEEVQLRVTKLRSLDGTLWFVRNGQIVRVGNMSQDYSRIVLDTAVGYGSDLDLVKEILARVVDEFATNPETRDTVMEKPDLQGVEAVNPDSVIIRILITTTPGEQWAASRELRERIKVALDEAGIAVPVPQQMMIMDQAPGTGPRALSAADGDAAEADGDVEAAEAEAAEADAAEADGDADGVVADGDGDGVVAEALVAASAADAAAEERERN